jgi:hypothetical protein
MWGMKMYMGDLDIYGRLRYIWETEICLGDSGILKGGS